jgi:predicted DNA-binding transcriptional regulator YafY
VRSDFFNTHFEQDAEPYGLVAKASIWYLVYGRGGNVQVRRLAQVVGAEILPGTFTRPKDFDLSAFWEKWCQDYESHPPFVARVRLSPTDLPLLYNYMEERASGSLENPSQPDAAGWVTLDLPFESFVTARTRLLGLGRDVEVLEPEPLRKSLVDFAEQVVAFYREPGSLLQRLVKGGSRP